MTHPAEGHSSIPDTFGSGGSWTDIVEAVLSRQINDLEAQLTRNGYDIRSLVEQFEAKPAAIRQLLRGELDASRTGELLNQMRAAGRPT